MLQPHRLEGWWRHTIGARKPGVADHVARAALLGAALPLEAVVRLRDLLYRTNVLAVLSAPIPVISFGNLTVGGTGKTPAVIWCARALAARGVRVAVASRGYNPSGKNHSMEALRTAGVYANAESTAPRDPLQSAANDEALVIAEALPGIPHVSNADRAEAVKILANVHRANVVILDDGFQYRRLRRMLDFVLLDAIHPFGYGYLFPRGTLREPSSALTRATAVIITKSNLVPRDKLIAIRRRILEIDPNAKVAEAIHRPTSLVFAGGRIEPAQELKGKRVYGFCGLADPKSFSLTLKSLGAEVIDVRSFGDHHAYTRDELSAVFSEAALQRADLVVTTQKDRVKFGWPDTCGDASAAQADSLWSEVEADARAGRRVAPLAELRMEFELAAGGKLIEGMLEFLAAGITGATGATGATAGAAGAGQVS